MKEHQGREDYMNEESALPDGSKVNTHATEVLRQVEGAGLSEDTWAGGDS